MWIISPALAFVAAMTAHAILSHQIRPPLNMVTRFVAPGLPIGIVLLAVLLLEGNSAVEVIGGLLCYALVCEVYIFVFTMVSSSVTVSLLLKLRHGRANWADLDAEYSDEAMVDGRLAKLVTNGLIAPDPSGFAVTARGEGLVASYVRLRRFFRHPGFEVEPPPRRTGRVEAQPAAGQDVG